MMGDYQIYACQQSSVISLDRRNSRKLMVIQTCFDTLVTIFGTLHINYDVNVLYKTEQKKNNPTVYSELYMLYSN